MALSETVLALAAVLSLSAAQAQTITGQDILNHFTSNNNASFSVAAAGGTAMLGLKDRTVTPASLWRGAQLARST